MRLVLAVGGSAGHIYPALAVVEALREIVPELRAFWLGRPGSIEEDLVRREPGIAFIPFRSAGIPRAQPLRGTRTLLSLPRSVWRAVHILEELSPDVVLGMGSYTSFAPGMAARLLGIPLVIHEQNVSLGLANRVLARFATRVLLGFPQTLEEVPHRSKAKVTGTPVRRCIVERRTPYRGGGYLLVLGGSLGSSLLVNAVEEGAEVLRRLPGFAALVSVGRFGEPVEVEGSLKEAGLENLQVVRWIGDMGAAYAGARLVISRAGASTVAEVLAAGRPAIFVPWLGAAGGHQEKNAYAVSAGGGAFLLLEDEVRRGRLTRMIARLWNDPRTLREVARRASRMARPEAAETVAQELLGVAEGLRWTTPACT
jgi:UDP-N-acetylglucosamine--N-acetylmuramyl-(pentapeptide) pyrophosphoryl-undecaprenol N-acetylglucosamine transferase